MAKRDFYEVLGLQKGADEKALKAAYRNQAKKFHPDNNPGDKAAEAKFKEISEAYDVLKDGDLLLVMGAGDIGHVASDIATRGFTGAGKP